MIVGIDGSRCKSGGAIAHLLGILKFKNVDHYKIERVHIWVTKSVISKIPNHPWIKVHVSPFDNWPILFQLFWQRFILPIKLNDNDVKVLLSLDAGTLIKFPKMITISQDMLSFEPGAMQKYSWGKKRLRLEILKFVQIKSLSFPNYCIYLTEYAKETLIPFTFNAERSRVIPHGIDDFIIPKKSKLDYEQGFNILYISNIAEYKNQENVLIAIHKLRESGYNTKITFVGGGSGNSFDSFLEKQKDIDSNQNFSKLLPFIERDKLSNLFNESNLFLFASSCENMPITLLEGMTSHLPILCSNRGPMPAMLKEAGYFFDPEDVNSIVKSFIDFTKTIETNEFNNKILKANEYASEYTWEKTSKNIWRYVKEIYDER